MSSFGASENIIGNNFIRIWYFNKKSLIRDQYLNINRAGYLFNPLNLVHVVSFDF